MPKGQALLKRPASSTSVAADSAGECLHPASIDEFFQFMQCQLRMETREVMGQDVELQDPAANAIWEDYVKIITPNLGSTERWVPFHTVFGVHERFLVESVHHRSGSIWNDKRRFLAIFIFRAHCKRDFFLQAQLPFLLEKDFWKDPVGSFRPNGPLEQAMLRYRKTTKRPLLTLCFRMIPERILKDNDQNLVRSILLRTQRLLEVAEDIWPVLQDTSTSSESKFHDISELLLKAKGLGETWAKMILVCLDLAYPKLQLLERQCEVGIGALGALRCLLQEPALEEPKEALKTLTTSLNSSATPSSKHFWKLLPSVEALARKKFSNLPLILKQVRMGGRQLSTVIVQVQLCEYRQFRNGLARRWLNLPCDDSMKATEREARLKPEDHLNFDAEKQAVTFQVPTGDSKKVTFEIALAGTRGCRPLAERVALMCFERLYDGESKKEVEEFRNQIYKQCDVMHGKDVPEKSVAWKKCRGSQNYTNPAVCFSYEYSNGKKDSFQTTATAAGGCLLEAERIARLCYHKFEAGAKKEDVLAYRKRLYKDVPDFPLAAPRKRPRTGETQ